MSVERKAFVFNDEQMTEFKEDIANIDRKISPHATNLTPEEKQPMLKEKGAGKKIKYLTKNRHLTTIIPKFKKIIKRNL
jgi:hypothetical protein